MGDDQANIFDLVMLIESEGSGLRVVDRRGAQRGRGGVIDQEGQA